MTNKADHCTACGIPWEDHLGIIPTCKNLQQAVSALKAIHIWATFRNGAELDPDHVEELIKSTFKQIV